jgi:hypothetical protein
MIVYLCENAVSRGEIANQINRLKTQFKQLKDRFGAKRVFCHGGTRDQLSDARGMARIARLFADGRPRRFY